MQSPLFEPDPSALPQIEPPSAWSHAVFEEPMMAMIVIGLIGVVILLMLRARGKLWWGLAGLVAAGLMAGGLLMASRMVETDRELVSDRARGLVAAVAVGDRAGMLGLMGESVVVQTRFASAKGRDRVVELAARVPGLAESVSVAEIQADFPGPRVGRTMVKVRVDGSYAPSSSWWMIHWERGERGDAMDDGWVAVYIEPLWIQGVNNPGG